MTCFILSHSSLQAFTPATLRTLIKTLPGKDNTNAVNDYLKDGGDKKRLGAAEAFTIELQKVPQLELFLQSFLYMTEFEAKKADIKPAIEVVRLASREVFGSRRFARIIQIVLFMGTFAPRCRQRAH